MKNPASLQTELKRLYHNASLHSTLSTSSEFESDLFQQEFEFQAGLAIDELQDEFKHLGRIYQYGRGGRTVAPDMFIRHMGGSSFRIKSADDLEFGCHDMTPEFLAAELKRFNDAVINWCKSAPDSILQDIRNERAAEIEANKGKRRIVRTVTEYK